MNRALCKLAVPQRCHGEHVYLKIINKKRIFENYVVYLVVYYMCRHNIFRDIVTEMSNVKV